ncbi:MAG: DedA family protein [Candidatus Dadabacteria bacterium]|nr:DedA family protein [Candidatus Dadabacteria bacterium]MCZ6864108.1 DedA family protein [Candidatus Dadabacteria bacterium]
MFRRLYNWVLGWADTKYGVPALAIVSFAESSFFPVPPDPLLMALSLGKPKRAFWYALVCSVMSVLGGIFGYFIGWALWGLMSSFFLTYVFSPEAFDFVRAQYEQNAFLAILGAAITPIPYKVFTVTAGVFHINLLYLILASAIGRSARFFLEAGLVYFFGEQIRNFIDKYFNLLVTLFFILVLAGFFIVKFLLKHWCA